MRRTFLLIALLATAVGCAPQQKQLTDYVNPLLGTATLWDSVDLGFPPHETHLGCRGLSRGVATECPGAGESRHQVPQRLGLPVRGYGDLRIHPLEQGSLEPVPHPAAARNRTPTPEDYCSPYSHDRETAAPGYYEVFLDRYGVDAELTTTLRCALHRYTFPEGAEPSVLADLQRSNERVRGWEIRREGDRAFAGWQRTGETMYFYAEASRPVLGDRTGRGGRPRDPHRALRRG